MSENEGCAVVEVPVAEAKVSKADTIVVVNRTMSLQHPDWVEEVMFPDLKFFGPRKYDLINDVELWIHDGQNDLGVVDVHLDGMDGYLILEILVMTNRLRSCLGFDDMLSIQKMGPEVFQRFARGNAVIFWRFPVKDHHGCIRVPQLVLWNSTVCLFWPSLDGYWNACYKGARLK